MPHISSASRRGRIIRSLGRHPRGQTRTLDWDIAGSMPAIHYGPAFVAPLSPSSEIIATMSKLSIIMPVLDEGDGIAAALDALADLRALGTEVIVVDGGSQIGRAHV